MAPLPIIDLSEARSGDAAAKRRAADEILAACRSAGFFYLVGHGVPQRLVEEAAAASRAFFALPAEQTQTVAVNRLYRGYTGLQETIGNDGVKRRGGREFFNLGLELPADAPSVRAGELMCGPNSWPDDPPGFRQAVYAYFEAVCACGAQLLRLIALSLGVRETFFADKYNEHITQCSLLHYPPLEAAAPPGAESIPVHRDYGCITLLWQDEVGGLFVRERQSGELIEAPPLPGSFVVNVGDMLARWSNDRFASTPHGVTNRSGRDRYSIAVFYNPGSDAVIDPRELGVSSVERRYAPVTAGAYLRGRFEDLYAPDESRAEIPG